EHHRRGVLPAGRALALRGQVEVGAVAGGEALVARQELAGDGHGILAQTLVAAGSRLALLGFLLGLGLVGLALGLCLLGGLGLLAMLRLPRLGLVAGLLLGPGLAPVHGGG